MTFWFLPKFAATAACIGLIAALAAQTQAPPPSASDREATAAASRAERDRELKLLGISEANLAQLRYLGTGPAYVKITGRQVRYMRADVAEWIEQQTRVQTPGVRGRAPRPVSA